MGGLFAEGEQTRANKPYFTAKTQPNNKQMNVYVVDNNVRVDKTPNPSGSSNNHFTTSSIIDTFPPYSGWPIDGWLPD